MWQISSIQIIVQTTQDTVVRGIYLQWVEGPWELPDSPHSKDWRLLLLNIGRKDWVCGSIPFSSTIPGTHNGWLCQGQQPSRGSVPRSACSRGSAALA